MVRKTQIKQKKSKSQLRKTLKHYSKTNNNKKGGHKSGKKVHEIPFVPNPFSYKHERIRINPLHVLNNNNNNNSNSNLPEGFGVNKTTYNNSLYSNATSLSSGSSNNGYMNVGSSNSNQQSMPSDISNGNNGYVSVVGYQNSTNTNHNPLYTPMNPIYNKIGVPGERNLRKNLTNGNLLKNTAKA